MANVNRILMRFLLAVEIKVTFSFFFFFLTFSFFLRLHIHYKISSLTILLSPILEVKMQQLFQCQGQRCFSFTAPAAGLERGHSYTDVGRGQW